MTEYIVMTCLCGQRIATQLFASGLYDVIKCSRCGQVRTRALRGEKRIGYYEQEDVQFYIDKQDMFRQLFRQLLGFIHKFAPKGTLLDIGAGVGLLLDEARKMGYRVMGFEPSKASVAAAKKYFGINLIPKEFSGKSLERKDYTLEPRVRGDDNKRSGDDGIDIVVINHVLEHLKNPKEIIGLCAETLSDAGVLVIGVPNFNSFMRWIKRGKWQSLIPGQHRWQFTLTSLDQLVLPHGFRRIAVSYENHDRSMHYWWKKPIYRVLDWIALWTGYAEAMLVIYKKISNSQIIQ